MTKESKSFKFQYISASKAEHVGVLKSEMIVLQRASGDDCTHQKFEAKVLPFDVSEKILLNPIKKKKIIKKIEDSATVFLLKERDKIEETAKKSITKEAISSYKQIVDSDYKSNGEEDESETQNKSCGTLINKRHY
jgi:hypothetical protein